MRGDMEGDMGWIAHWNQRYDRVPEDYRFGLLVAVMLLIGMLNMLLTIHVGFPFGLLLLVAILFAAAVRLTYVMETPPDARGLIGSVPRKLHIDWVYALNHWYDGLSEDRQFWVVPIVLMVVGFVNMALTVAHAFPFGLLFLFGLLGLVAIRLPYTRGWLREPPSLSLAGASAVTHAPPIRPALTQDQPSPTSLPQIALPQIALPETALPEMALPPAPLSSTPISEPGPLPPAPHVPEPPQID